MLKEKIPLESWRVNLSVFFLSIMVLMLPLYQKASVISILFFVFINVTRKDILNLFLRSLTNKVNVLMILFYMIHVFGVLYSTNYPYALADLETKLSFIVFPLVIPFIAFNSKSYRMIYFSLIAGCTIAGLICTVNSLVNFNETHNAEVFVYEHYSFWLHPTYFTLYLNLALIFTLDLILTDWKKLNLLKRTLYISVTAFLMLNIILIDARTATAASYLTVFIFAAYVIFKTKAYVKGISIVFVSLAAAFFMQYKAMHIATDRLEQIENIMKSDSTKLNSVSIRKYLWSNAFEVISENPVFGVGTGDIKEELILKYKKNNFEEGIRKNYSPHSQFLRTAVILGIVGLFILLAMFIFPFIFAFKKGELVFCLFLIMVFINCITEDIVEVQSGIIFFAFFNSLFYWKTLKAHEK